jgi:hypothetical protein
MVEVHNAQATIYITSKKILFVLFQIKFQLAIMSYLREKKRIKDQVRYFYNALIVSQFLMFNGINSKNNKYTLEIFDNNDDDVLNLPLIYTCVQITHHMEQR